VGADPIRPALTPLRRHDFANPYELFLGSWTFKTFAGLLPRMRLTFT
jgi:hypothetical protein